MGLRYINNWFRSMPGPDAGGLAVKPACYRHDGEPIHSTGLIATVPPRELWIAALNGGIGIVLGIAYAEALQ